MRNKTFILLLIPLCGTLYAQNINPGKSGGGTSSSSVTNIVNAAQVWTNAGGTVKLLGSPTLVTNAPPLDVAGLATLYGGLQLNPTGIVGRVTSPSTNFIYADANDNLGIGIGTGHTFSSGVENVSLGSGSLANNTDGQDNVSIGYQAMNGNYHGSGNVAMGTHALLALVDGSDNTAIGFEALSKNVSSDDNTAVGWDSLDSATGRANSALGKQALHFMVKGNDNVAFGYRAGYQSGTNQCTFIGSGADNANFPGTNVNATAIGYGAKVTNDNQVVLGNSSVTVVQTSGLLSAGLGIATLLHNTSTNTLIAVGASPFNFTNTASQTIVVYLDANGATTTANLNGQTIFKSLAAGDHTIILKPGAYTTVTYAIATPIMSWTEL